LLSVVLALLLDRGQACLVEPMPLRRAGQAPWAWARCDLGQRCRRARKLGWDTGGRQRQL